MFRRGTEKGKFFIPLLENILNLNLTAGGCFSHRPPAGRNIGNLNAEISSRKILDPQLPGMTP
jgi:hypothetical protein